MEGGKGRNIRDTERYYYTIFGQPTETGKWGLSIEGHHLSLNFVVENGEVISSTPNFFASNPAVVSKKVKGSSVKKGTRILAKEETIAFELVNALDEEQLKKALIAEKAPREIRAAGEAIVPADEGVGILVSDLKQPQMKLIRSLVETYLGNLPTDVAEAKGEEIIQADPRNIRFAWAGSLKPGVGHYYRIQGSTFLIEFVNTQPGSDGTPANHIHAVLRDMNGDFAIPVKK